MGQACAEELDEFFDHAVLAQHLRDDQHQVGGGRAFGQLAGQFESNHFRKQHVDRLAEHDRLGFDAADAPADDAQAVDHRGVRIGADQRIGIQRHVVAWVWTQTTLARYSRFTWCTIPVAGGTTRKLSNAFWPHLRNS